MDVELLSLLRKLRAVTIEHHTLRNTLQGEMEAATSEIKSEVAVVSYSLLPSWTAYSAALQSMVAVQGELGEYLASHEI